MTKKSGNEWEYARFSKFRARKNAVAAAYFKNQAFKVSDRYPFILADRNDWQNNIIQEDVADRIVQLQAGRRALKKPFPLHKYIHHGLSSQAMLFNLLGPLIVSGRLDVLAAALAEEGIPVPGGPLISEFEVENRKVFAEQKQAQPTSIDVVLSGTSGPSLFIEAKFVEQCFGGCSLFEAGDCEGRNPVSSRGSCYLDAKGLTYWAKMEEHGFLTGVVASSPICVLAPYYQFFREVLFALENKGHFVLLCDRDNPVFLRDGPDGPRGFFPFLKGLVPTEHQDKIHYLTIQKVCNSIESSDAGGDWIVNFRKKYGIT